MERIEKRIGIKAAVAILGIIAVSLILCIANLGMAIEPHWPREITVPEGVITMYQPQLESFKENKIRARAVVSVLPKGESEPVFGVVWLAARVSTDRDTRTVRLLEIDIPQVKFPDAPHDKIDKLTALLKDRIMKWDLDISLDRLLTQLDLVEKEKTASKNLKSTPPRVVIVTHPAVLVTIDGEVQMQKMDDSPLMRVVNTPFFIVFDGPKKVYYLKGGEEWFTAQDIGGAWEVDNNPPAAVVASAKKAQFDEVETDSRKRDQMPQIIVATKPTELIVIDGAAKYSTIFGTDLLYVANTESDLFLDIDSQLNYVLLSGRWFSAKSMKESVWTYVPGDKLPADFAKIPVGSIKDNVLAGVPGTKEAGEAVLEAYIPQTATVKRSEAKVDVVYDGDPKFVKIEDSDMSYAANTSSAVIRYGNNYYCCHEGVWFVATSPTGPWEVCVAVPQVIYTIPPSCPVYHVRYVYVYNYTPEVVYVGYTPGYVGCYVYGGTVVYGTGYVYPGWYHTHYYARPHTWGFAVRYNPHTGNWGFRFGYGGAGGWFVGGGYRRGWWGAGGRRDIDIDINRNINIDRSRNNLYNRRGDVARGPGSGRPGSGRPGASRPGTGKPGVGRPVTTRPATRPAKKDNLFAGRDGNVFRQTDKGWQKRDSGSWSNHKPSSSQLDRQSAARQRGTDRTNNFDRSRTQGGGRTGGSRRGGGRGGRR